MKALCAVSLILTLAAGCGSADSSADASASGSASAASSSAAVSEPAEQKEVIRTVEKTYTDASGNELLKTSVVRPDLSAQLSPDALAEVDRYYTEENKNDEQFWQELADLSQDAFENEPDFAATFLVDENYQIAAEGENYISVVRTANEWTGGVHGNVAVFAEVFRKDTGEKLTLEMLFENGHIPEKEIAEKLAILAQPKVESGEYFEDAAMIAGQTYDTGRFYLTEDSLVFIFDPYELAPFAAGVQQLAVPTAELTGFTAP